VKNLVNFSPLIVNNLVFKRDGLQSRQVADHFIKGGNTVNLNSIDLSKAFDKANHQALLIKLIKRKLPVALLDLLEN